MTQDAGASRLDRPVDSGYDHVLGPEDAAITLVEYGSYACPHCRAANDEVARLRDRFGDRMRYVFRQRPIETDLARPAAELAERAEDAQTFWSAHVALMTRSPDLTAEDLEAVAAQYGLTARERGVARVDADIESARASGVRFTPTFFINGRRYDGPWDETSLSEAMLGSLGHRVQSAAIDFARWAPATGVLLLLASVAAILLTNSPLGPAFESFWREPLSVTLGAAEFRLSVLHWINDGLLTLFFLVVGLEVKREFTVGRLASRRAAALPIAAAIGGLALPAALYLLFIPEGAWARGAGVPMPTDTAFAVALIVMLGRRVPVELRVFLTAASIVDDIGTIAIVAVFYSGELHLAYLSGAAVCVGLLGLLHHSGVYRAWPYALVGVVLWACLHGGGVHATLAGVILALFVPTRPPADLRLLMAQAQAVIEAERRHGDEVLRHGPSTPTLEALDAIHDRIESPANRVLRKIEPWSSYGVLPLFALANAGVLMSAAVFAGRETLAAAIITGLVAGKPLGFVLASALAVRAGLADKPAAYTWSQLLGAGALAGIGFTMSLFIAAQAFPVPDDFAAAKIAVFCASAVSALLGVAVLSTRKSSPASGGTLSGSDPSLKRRSRVTSAPASQAWAASGAAVSGFRQDDAVASGELAAIERCIGPAQQRLRRGGGGFLG